MSRTLNCFVDREVIARVAYGNLGLFGNVHWNVLVNRTDLNHTVLVSPDILAVVRESPRVRIKSIGVDDARVWIVPRIKTMDSGYRPVTVVVESVGIVVPPTVGSNRVEMRVATNIELIVELITEFFQN